MTLGCCTRNEDEHYKKTKGRGDENYGPPHPHCLSPYKIMGLRVTEVQCQLLHQCHQGLEVPGIHTAVDNAAVKPTSRGDHSETTPQENDGLVSTQHQTRKTSLGQINGKPLLLPWMSTGASAEDG